MDQPCWIAVSHLGDGTLGA